MAHIDSFAATVSAVILRSLIGGPTRTRTWDQWIHELEVFPPRADYLTTLDRIARARDAHACY